MYVSSSKASRIQRRVVLPCSGGATSASAALSVVAEFWLLLRGASMAYVIPREASQSRSYPYKVAGKAKNALSVGLEPTASRFRDRSLMRYHSEFRSQQLSHFSAGFKYSRARRADADSEKSAYFSVYSYNLVRAALYPTWTSAAIQVLLESRHSSKNNHLCIRGSRFGLSKVKALCPTISQGGAKRDVVLSGFRYFPKSSDVEGKVGSHGCNMKYLERAMQSLRTLGYQLITKHWPTSYEIRDIIYMLIPLERSTRNDNDFLGPNCWQTSTHLCHSMR